jgi:RimJ/RimL family protein N-acetyltransferase
MSIQLNLYQGEAQELIDFLTSETWPFHGASQLKEEEVIQNINNQVYVGDDRITFWISLNETKVGMIRVFDLEDETPLFDIRIKHLYRQQGIGQIAIRQMLDYVFSQYDHVLRVEGYTRIDNVGMRQLFRKCGFIKEAHHRQAWKSDSGVYYDTIGYGLLKQDFLSNSITPINWDDL